MNHETIQAVANTVRCLTMDAIQKANSGHPGMPMGCAELGALLYGSILKYNPDEPLWINRDRFVLSAGHGSMFLYSLLHLAGFSITLDDIKNFRQLGSPCAGHPEYGLAPGIEMTTGPLGQGFATAVGMAIAETMLAARYNTREHTIFDYYTYVLAGDGCLQEGVASEAASLAGHLKLKKLIAFYDSNKITIDGSTTLAFTEDVALRFSAYGWNVFHANMYDTDDIERHIEIAKKESDKPTLIILKSIIGKGAPTLQGSHKTHGAPLGEDEIKKAKENMGIAPDTYFYRDPEALSYFEAYKLKLQEQYTTWKEKFTAWQKQNSELAEELALAQAGKPVKVPQWPLFKLDESIATRTASGKALLAAIDSWPNLVGGSADLTGPNATEIPGEPYSAENHAGRKIHFGVREFGMAAIANGLALSKILRPFCATFLVFSDYLRPALRLSALMKIPVIYVLTHDSVYLGEDGPTHQPIEHLSSLRAIPNLTVLRPADAEETVLAWELALAKTDGPTALILSRQNLPVLPKDDPNWKDTIKTGAYVIKNTPVEPEITILASGSEVSLALEATKKTKKQVRVVSVLSLETFLEQPEPIQTIILGKSAKLIACEAGHPMSWYVLTNTVLGIKRFGESGPGTKVAEHLGISVANLLALIESV
ncbi:MAG TPA: transketolase [Spirochaetales bacterium]|nr:transketolase [Spirochaetales bacterium]